MIEYFIMNAISERKQIVHVSVREMRYHFFLGLQDSHCDPQYCFAVRQLIIRLGWWALSRGEGILRPQWDWLFSPL